MAKVLINVVNLALALIGMMFLIGILFVAAPFSRPRYKIAGIPPSDY